MSGWRVALFSSAAVTATLVVSPSATSRRAAQRTDRAYALVIQKDGRLIAAGSSDTRFALARFRTNGDLDPSFGHGGRVVTSGVGTGSQLHAIAIQRDGRIVAGGGRAVAGGLGAHVGLYASHGRLVRYTAAGRLDPSFGNAGMVNTGFFAQALTVQPDGKIVAAGGPMVSHQFGPREGAVARYTSSGTLDRGFGNGGMVRAGFTVAAASLQADGKIVLLGTGSLHPGTDFDGLALARYNADGTLDRTFGTGGQILTSLAGTNGETTGAALAIQTDGKIVAGGTREIYGYNVHRFVFARYNPDGRLDTSFGSGGTVRAHFGLGVCNMRGGSDEFARAVAIQRDGRIIAVGVSNAGPRRLCPSFLFARFFSLARYTAHGALDPTFGRGGKAVTRGIVEAGASVLQRNGKIVVAGVSHTESGDPGTRPGTASPGSDFALARYTIDGRLDASFGRGGKVLTDFGFG